MKKILFSLFLLSATITLSQQKTFEKEVIKISKKIDIITKQQKDSLKVKVLAIEKRFKSGQISKESVESLKQDVAAYHARRIEELVSEQEQLLQALVQDKTNGKIASSEVFIDTKEDENTFTIGNKRFRLNISDENKSEAYKMQLKRNKRTFYDRTTTQLVFAMGTNNVLENHKLSSLNDSDYQFWRSRFYELGLTFKTRFTNNPSQFYFKYGISFLWNNLRLEDNRIHALNGNMTEIQTFPNNLTESRLRHVQMNFPVHLEWDLSDNIVYADNKVSDVTNESVRLGIGGFVGFKLGTRQYLEYKDADGIDIEETQYNNFNMNTVNYGISAYVGYKFASLYVKYDLNPLFKNTEIRNISMGVRVDLN